MNTWNIDTWSSDSQTETAYYRTVALPAGELHVYASDSLFAELPAKVFEMANNNLLIPNAAYMSYTPDVHVGVGTCIGTTAVWGVENGYVSPSIVGNDIGCGMRVHLTNMHRDELKEVKVRRKLIKRMGKYVPLNMHERGYFSDIRLEHVLKKGVHGLPNKYVPDIYTPKKTTSLTHLECGRFSFDEKVLDEIPEPIWHRAHRQLGTLGSGNHFAEVQAIEIDEHNREIAEAWGLFDGQVVIMIHSGSRAWGGAVSEHGIKAMGQWMRASGQGTPDPRLTFAPLAHPFAQSYVNLMYSALNYAVVNRHLIAYGIREAFRDVFGNQVEMRTLYDLMHNYAWEEMHQGQRMFVHRKGATRALPPQHPDNPKPYMDTGHPALIPGSMGSRSYLMVGRDGGSDNYYSICHGAGRVRSRSATKQVVTVEEFAASLKVGKKDEIVVNQPMLESIVDESPQAYKNVEHIIESVVGAGLAEVVAVCQPLAALKGA
ncbi:RtcB family protein [Paenibacillus assamensis]|uniref:RtcB family protein n=1 Tax=Paenibacillus assamensis TaxID=311244 RepID=UPI000418CFFB|nr:RtcB family protein [Paenibacillus assamensis]